MTRVLMDGAATLLMGVAADPEVQGAAYRSGLRVAARVSGSLASGAERVARSLRRQEGVLSLQAGSAPPRPSSAHFRETMLLVRECWRD